MKGIIFDFNGTLFFDTRFHLEAWRQIVSEYSEDYREDADISFVIGPRNDELIRRIAPALSKEERDAVSVRKEALYRQICQREAMDNPENVRLTAGAGQLLQFLKERSVPLALASASIPDNIEFYYETFGLECWFPRQLCVYDDGSYAHKGEMQRAAAEKLGVALSDCIVVEDSLSAIAHAREAGAGMIVGIGEEAKHPELKKAGADRCICDFTEFQKEWL